MRFGNNHRTALSLTLALASPAFAASEENEGFLEGTQVHVSTATTSSARTTATAISPATPIPVNGRASTANGGTV